MGKITNTEFWRAELALAEEFRDKEFGKYTQDERNKAGENIDYYENGACTGFDYGENSITTLNLFHIIVKLIVPSLWFTEAEILALPLRKEDETSAPFAKHILNHFYKQNNADEENENVVWDGYVLNRGISKVGYVTKFGMDTKDKEKKKEPDIVKKAIAALKGQKEEEEEVHPEADVTITSEEPYIKWVNPFKFLMDPRTSNINEAMWVSEEFRKNVKEIKANKSYKNTGDLEGETPELTAGSSVRIPETLIEDYKTCTIYEIHYRSEGKIYRLVLAKYGDVIKELYHEESIYNLNEFQYDILEFNSHRHLQFKKSDLMKIKNLQDRFTSTVDSILEQLDRLVPKIAVDRSAVKEDGYRHLMDGDIGTVVDCTKNPNEVFKELMFTQLKKDLKVLLDQIVDFITITTGITKSKLLGISTGDTATGENIAQGGENIRMLDMDKKIRRFAKRQANKFWSVITQFVPLEEVEVITGEKGVDPQTGNTLFSWLPPVTSDIKESLQAGKYRFDIGVGSIKQVNTEIITKRIENLISILARTDVIALMQQQGKKVDVAEILKLWLQNNPEIVRDTGRIIQEVNEGTQGLLPAEEMLLGGQGGMTAGSDLNAIRKQEAQPPARMPAIMREAGQA